MALDDNPYVFRHGGKLWVSELPREEMLRQLADQSAWDAANARHERWGLAIAIGAAAGVLVFYLLGSAAGLPPVVNLFVLPVGFAVGAVLGAVVNRRVRAVALQNSPLPPRPAIAAMVRIPPEVIKRAPEDSTAKQLVDWSRRGFVG
ncbi:hypothetical protein BH11ACT4_BH11ACT4_05350 [soil metagenome]